MKKFCVTILFVFQSVHASQPFDAVVVYQKDIANGMKKYAHNLNNAKNYKNVSIKELSRDLNHIDQSNKKCAASLKMNHDKIAWIDKKQLELQETLKLQNDLWLKENSKRFNAQSAIESYKLSLQRFEKLSSQQRSQEVSNCCIPGVTDKNSLMNYLQLKAAGHFIQHDETSFNKEKEINLAHIENLRSPVAVEIQENVANKKMLEGEQLDIKSNVESYDALFSMYATLRQDQAKIKRADFLQQCFAKHKVAQLRKEKQQKEAEQLKVIADAEHSKNIFEKLACEQQRLQKIKQEEARLQQLAVQEQERLKKEEQIKLQAEQDKKAKKEAARIAQSEKAKAANALRRQEQENARLQKIEDEKQKVEQERLQKIEQEKLEAQRIVQEKEALRLDTLRLQQIEDEKIAEKAAADKAKAEQRAQEQLERRAKKQQDRDEQKRKEQAAQALKIEQDRIAKLQADEMKKAEELARKKKAQEDARVQELADKKNKIKDAKAKKKDEDEALAAAFLIAEQERAKQQQEQADKKTRDEEALAAALLIAKQEQEQADKKKRDEEVAAQDARRQIIQKKVKAAEKEAAQLAATEKEAQQKAKNRLSAQQQALQNQACQLQKLEQSSRLAQEKEALAQQQASLNRAFEINTFQNAFQVRSNEFKQLQKSGKTFDEIAPLMTQYDRKNGIFAIDKNLDLQIVAAVKHLLTLSMEQDVYLISNIIGVIRGIDSNLKCFHQSIHTFFASEDAIRHAVASRYADLNKVCDDNVDLKLLDKKIEELLSQRNIIVKNIESLRAQCLSKLDPNRNLEKIQKQMHDAHYEYSLLGIEFNNSNRLMLNCTMLNQMKILQILINPKPKL